MSKIRINELARELEVKPSRILDMLPELGVSDKKTHSSSLDDDVALTIRQRLAGEGGKDGHDEADFHEAPEPVALRTAPEPVRTETPVAAPPAVKVAETPQASAPAAGAAQPAAAPPPGPAPAHAEGEAPAKTFLPLRPPLGAGQPLHPPLQTPGARPPAMPLRPPAPSVPAGPSAPAAPRPAGVVSGPRQPLPSDVSATARSAPPPAIPRPAPPAAPPAAMAAPAGPGAPAMPLPPAARTPLRPAGAAPGSPAAPMAPGAPARQPLMGRPLAGQPAARPVVPPRPDLVARLQRTAAPQPGAPKPGMPSRPAAPRPGQPLYQGPVRPGQPLMRGPGGPGGPGGPSRGRGPRPMHPTSLLPAAPPPTTETGRRHQTKPGARSVRRTKDTEGILRPAISRREPTENLAVNKEITISEGITVKELSEKMGVKANLVIKKLVEKKIFATINQTLDMKMAEELARDFGAATSQISYEEETTHEIAQTEVEQDRELRPPVVTIMGHVDHGKTSLLDAIRLANVAEKEAGGITQHIGAYTVDKNGKKIVFIDTPGHEAFTRMRARGAKVTDIVILVVAADDGVMPQTLEAIDHAKAAQVPILVAINKIDKPEAQPDRIKQQLADRGLLAEDWGGDVVMVPVSAKAKTNLDLLLEMILLVADMGNLRANPARPGMGSVLEAQLDRGRGPVATVLVRNGSLKIGDFFICGNVFGKVRAMFDDRGGAVREAGPSIPVEVLGLDALPDVGDTFQVVTDTAKAKQIVMYREQKTRDAQIAKANRMRLDSIHEQLREGETKELNVIIKADVGGTAEVLTDTLQKLSTDKVRIRVLHSGVGAITETDVLLAAASEAIIVGFHVRPERNAVAVAEQEKVDLRLHTIIYELTDEVKRALAGLLDPVFKETYKGRAEVREVFRISKVGTVAGCIVSDGLIVRNAEVRLLRDNVVVHTGKIDSLKRFKNDASEVKSGTECGIGIAGYQDIKPGDVIEAFVTERVAPTLG